MTVRRWLTASSMAASLAAAIGLASSAHAVELSIEFENFAPTDGFVLTPLWVSAHDGSFDLFDMGAPASPGLETIAETGDASGLTAEIPAGAEDTAGIGNPPVSAHCRWWNPVRPRSGHLMSLTRPITSFLASRRW